VGRLLNAAMAQPFDSGFFMNPGGSDEADFEERLRHASKMEAVGRLAGGVAHDFNNLLVAIRGYTELVAATMTAGDPRREDLEQVLRAADRAAEMTRKLLAFGRIQPLEPNAIDPMKTLDELAPLLRRLLGEDIDLVIEAGLGKWQVMADPSQLEQAIVNLAVNARDAMPAGGTLTIELFSTHLNEDVAAVHPEIPAGPYVVLVVSDTGIGMDPDTLAHAFEPYYTTKAPGSGTGLGLASVYGFVKQSGGFVYVGSAPGRGTDFTIYLPRVFAPVVISSPAEPAASPQGGTQTVMVVEDDGAVREFVRRVLEPLGYRLLTAATAAEALSIASDPGLTIDLLIADVGVPDMRGPVLAAQIRAARPRMRVLLASGYTESTLTARGELEPGAALLGKPFTTAELAQAVHDALEA
jgi:two-component system cell cycle sensor histidine kinase/response regulator CckA